jgi:hypothetical protein
MLLEEVVAEVAREVAPYRVDMICGVDPKLETLKIGTNCSERRFGWQPGYSVWSFGVR